MVANDLRSCEAFIQLVDGTITIVDAEDSKRLSIYDWRLHPQGYAVRNEYDENGKSLTIYMHREILSAPLNVQCHHKDHDKLNNKKSNLVLTTVSDHMRHHALIRSHKRTQKPTKGRRFKGTKANCKRWEANIRIDGRCQYLGLHETEEEAAVVFDAAIIAFIGPGAYTNLIPNP